MKKTSCIIDFNKKLIFLFINLIIHPSCAMDAPPVFAKSMKLTCLIRKVAWSPDGNYIAGSQGNSCEVPHLILWDATGNEIWKKDQFGITESIGFSPDSKSIVNIEWSYNYSPQTPYNPHYLNIYDTKDGEFKWRSNAFNHIACFAYNHDSKKIAMAVEESIWPFNIENNVKIIDTQTKTITTFTDNCCASSLAYSPDGKILAASILLEDKISAIILFDSITHGKLQTIKYLEDPNPFFIHSLQFYHNDASKIISLSRERCIVLDLKTGFWKDFNKRNNNFAILKNINLSADNKKLIIAKRRNIEPSEISAPTSKTFITVLNTETGEVIADFENIKSVEAIACSPDMKKIALVEFLYTNIVTLPDEKK